MMKGSGTNSDMFSLFQLYSSQTKLLWSHLGFLPQGKMMIGLYFITLTQIKRRNIILMFTEIWKQVKEEHQGQHKHQVTIKVSHCSSFWIESLWQFTDHHKILNCQTEKNIYNNNNNNNNNINKNIKYIVAYPKPRDILQSFPGKPCGKCQHN